MKRFFIIVIIFAIVALAAFFVTRSRSTAPGTVLPTPSPYTLSSVNSWLGVVPGQSTLEQAVENLGKPASQTDSGSYKTLLYPSTNQYWNNEVVASDQTVVFVREWVFPPQETSYKTLIRGYTEAPTVLYGGSFTSGFVVYAYPSRGIAFYVNNTRDMTYQIWRFAPMPLASLLSLPQLKEYATQPVIKPE